VPTHIRAHVQWQVGSMLPRDIHQITPCFRHQQELDPLGGVDWDNLATDLLTIFAGAGGWVNKTGNQCTVKLYRIQDAVAGQPNRPKSVKIAAAGMSNEASIFREAALCLSFYGGNNFPDERGRLFLPAWVFSAALAARPTNTDITKAKSLAPLLSGLGGVNVDWITWSPTKKKATRVEKYFVDDEWDVQRRRGLQYTARVIESTSG